MLSYWDYLAALQSHDYVGRTYKARHGREASAKLIKQINANFFQAQEYYKAARKSDSSVRPLLSYYGISALSRGLILSLDCSQHEDSLTKSHGLQPVNWQETLSNNTRNVLEIEVTACRGTFCELAAASGNKIDGWFHIGPYPSRIKFTKNPDITDILQGKINISLGDCLSRIAALSQIYESTIGVPGNIVNAEIFYIAKTTNIPELQADISLFVSKSIDQNDMRDIFGLSGTTQIVHRSQTNWIQAPVYAARISGGAERDLFNQIPAFDEDVGEIASVVRRIKGRYDLSMLLRLYLTSYMMGMLVRYHPSIWISLLRNEKGDQAQPLLLSAMKVVEEKFLAEAFTLL